MRKKNKMNVSIIVSGYGGQGVLFLGTVLSYAAVILGKHTTWIPSYGAEMRGGSANCSVHISDAEIASPLIENADVVIALNLPSFKKFEKRVKKGGVIILNSSLCEEAPSRDDINYLKVPFNKLISESKIPAFINMVALGAFSAYTKYVKLDVLKEAVTKAISASRKHLIERNIESLELGAQYILSKFAVNANS